MADATILPCFPTILRDGGPAKGQIAVDYTNNAQDGASDQDDQLPFVPVSKTVMFRSRRAHLHLLWSQTADLALSAKALPALPIDALLESTSGKPARITPRPPQNDSEPKFSLFKTVSAMRGQPTGFNPRP